VLYGATAGYLGGRVDALMMRVVDILYSLPFIFFVIILMVVFHRNFYLLFIAIGAVEWLTMAAKSSRILPVPWALLMKSTDEQVRGIASILAR